MGNWRGRWREREERNDVSGVVCVYDMISFRRDGVGVLPYGRTIVEHPGSG